MSNFNGHDAFDLRNALQVLRAEGAKFWIEDGALRYRVPKGRLSRNEIAALCRADQTVLSLLFQQGGVRPEPRLLQRSDQTRAPLGFSQLAHWNIEGAADHRPIRQVASATNLRGPLDTGALNEALSVVVSRHGALRTRIVVRDREPVQEVSEHRAAKLPVVHLTPHKRELEIQRQITSAIVDAVDYAEDPLCVAVLLNLGPEENVLILAMEHIVSDGASLSIVFNELLTAHAQLVQGSRILLPPVRMQLADYAIWQRTELNLWLENRSSEWAARRRIEFPEDPNNEGTDGWGVVRFAIDARTRRLLHDWARRQGTSPVMTVLTAYIALVLRWCETWETAVQFISDGRMSSLLENTVGDITFPLFLPIRCEGHATFVGLLELITQQYCVACEKPDFFYGFVQKPVPEWVRNTCFNWLPERSRSDDRGLTTSLSCVNMTFEHPALETFDWDGEPGVTFWETANDVIGEMSFPRRRFSYPTMRRFTANFQMFLDTLLATPAKRIRDVSVT